MNVIDWLGEDNQIGVDIWEKKYRYNNESFEEWLDRVSGGNAKVRKLIEEKKFLYAGRILSNRGLHEKGQKITYSNCYVITPPEDSIESIFDCAKRLARTFSYGGGCGIDISKLSPKGAIVNNAAKQTSGSVSFMDLYSLTTELIGQNGRRGALMISLACDHPDVEDFITIKSDLSKVTKANISIRVTNDFLNAVVNNEDFKLSFTREETGEVIEKIVSAKDVFGKFCEMNWDYAEPAFLFWDRIKDYNLLQYVDDFEYAGVNPCAEEPLPAGGSCLLGSINLAEFVTEYKEFDYDSFKATIHTAVRGLNEVLDEGLALHPLQEQRDTVRDWRQIGLGIMGLADMLIKMEITYGSKQSIQLCEAIGYVLAHEAIIESQNLAESLGEFPKFTKDVYKSDFYKEHMCGYENRPLCNSQLLTIAPTGTLSTMLGISGGIEAIFANSYTRKTESLYGEDKYYKIFTPIAKQYLDEHSYGDDESKLPEWFVTSGNVPYRNRVDMQAVWQRHIDASISSTVNLPNNTTVNEVKDLYLYAWKEGLKGITIFRDGCKRLGILTTGDSEDNETPIPPTNGFSRGDIISVDDDLVGTKTKLTSGCGETTLQAFYDDLTGDPLETYISMGDGAGCERNLEAISRLISLCLRAGVHISAVTKQLKKVRPCMAYCNRQKTKGDCSEGTSCPDSIGRALDRLTAKMQDRWFDDSTLWVEEETPSPEASQAVETTEVDNGMICPECGSKLMMEGGCVICRGDDTHSGCGWSRCG